MLCRQPARSPPAFGRVPSLPGRSIVAEGADRAHRSFRSPLAGRFVRFAAKCPPGTRSPSVPPLTVPPAPPSSWRLHIYAGMRKVNRCYKGEKRALPASWVRSGPPFFTAHSASIRMNLRSFLPRLPRSTAAVLDPVHRSERRAFLFTKHPQRRMVISAGQAARGRTFPHGSPVGVTVPPPVHPSHAPAPRAPPRLPGTPAIRSPPR